MAPAPTKTPSHAASSAAAARSQRRSVRATSSRRGPRAEPGASCLFVLPGRLGALSWEEAAGRARPLVEALLPEAERTHVRLALEPVSQLRMDLGFLHSFDEALDFADGFASSWLGVVLEVNNAWIERRLYENIRRRPGRIDGGPVTDLT